MINHKQNRILRRAMLIGVSIFSLLIIFLSLEYLSSEARFSSASLFSRIIPPEITARSVREHSLAGREFLTRLIKKINPRRAVVSNPPASSIATVPVSGQASTAVSKKTPATTVTLAAIKSCLAKPGNESGGCMDKLFSAFLKQRSTADALALIATYEQTDTQLRYSCHPVVHAVGRETFLKKKTIHDSFTACDQTCHSGCYHGAMERFLRGEKTDGNLARHINEDEIKQKATTACDPKSPARFRFQCLHGLGHALLFSLDYKLEPVLATCDLLPTGWDRSSCYGGVFMENVFAAEPAKRDVSEQDYHYPCSKLDEHYKSDCYVMQTTRMSQMKLGARELFDECRKTGAHTLACIQSIGRDLSNDARINNPRPTAEHCELSRTDEEMRACIRGVIYALMDNTWDGQYAFPFCQTLSDPLQKNYCFAASAAYLDATYETTKQAMAAQCEKYLPEPAACIEEAAP